MKHRRAQAIEVGTRLDLAAKEFRRRITHRSDCCDALLLRRDPARDAEIYQHHAPGVSVYHQVRRLEVAVDERRAPGVQVIENVCDLCAPVRDRPLVYTPAGRIPEA